MNILKRVLGIVWLALALAAAYFCIFTFGVPKITSGKQDDLVFVFQVVVSLPAHAPEKFL